MHVPEGWVLEVSLGWEVSMGFLGGLFGRSRDRKHAATDRCMECGMTKGRHTDWCTASDDVAAASAAQAAPETAAPETAPEQEGEAPPWV
jgi:hypothetical protein